MECLAALACIAPHKTELKTLIMEEDEMSVTFDDIRPDFCKFHSFIRNDLDQIVKQKIGGNYAALALIMCACETLAQFHEEKRNSPTFFKRYLVPPDWKCVGDDIFKALRNGIVHGYLTKTICSGGKCIEIIVSWDDERHFKYEKKEHHLYINVKKLAERFNCALRCYERSLRNDAGLRESFCKGWQEIGKPVKATQSCKRVLDCS